MSDEEFVPPPTPTVPRLGGPVSAPSVEAEESEPEVTVDVEFGDEDPFDLWDDDDPPEVREQLLERLSSADPEWAAAKREASSGK